jgi:hypothetical protein
MDHLEKPGGDRQPGCESHRANEKALKAMSKAAEFWRWFRENEHRFRMIEVPEKDELLGEIQRALHEFSDDLWFEIGGHPEGPQELVITAEGKHRAFGLVKDLVSAAPAIPGWEFLAFKPAQGFAFVTTYRDITVSPGSTWFSVLPAHAAADGIDLRVAYVQFDPAKAKTYLAATYIMLEAGLGELAAAQIIHSIEVCAASSDPRAEGHRPLNELPAYLAESGYTISA